MLPATHQGWHYSPYPSRSCTDIAVYIGLPDLPSCTGDPIFQTLAPASRGEAAGKNISPVFCLSDCRVTQTTLWHVNTSCKIITWPIYKDLVYRYSVSSQKIQWGSSSRVYKTVRCPSVSLSHQSNAAAACGGFAAERRTRKRYQSTAPGARQQQRRSPGPQHGAQQQMRAMSCWQLN